MDFVEITPDLVGVVDREGTILFINPSFASLLGYSSTDLMRKNIETLLTEPTSSWDILSLGLDETNTSKKVVFSLKRSDGTKIVTSGHLCSWLGETGVRGFFIHLISPTIAGAPLKLDSSRLEELLGILSHDLTSIHQEVLSAIELAIAQDVLPESIANLLADALEEINRGERIVTNIVKLAHVGRADLELSEVNISTLFEQALEGIWSEFGKDALELVDFPSLSYSVQGMDQLVEVFRAILMTAIVLNRPEKAVVRLDVNEEPERSHFTMIFSIPGNGISDIEKQRLLAEPAEGINRTMGRLLTLADLIVKRIGGHFHVHDLVKGEPSRGVQFTLRLPYTMSLKNQGGAE
ncbi:MAG: PAS domain S-box protein [Candidatus Thorarchaeota archaeon]|nr:PAS domain S-box protein [Candidatus Thorarchaeota archaeon]